jgi:SP family myo-inositol transporter-like MFS transporter 13
MSFSTDADVKLPTELNENFDDQLAEVARDQATGEISEAAGRAEGEEKVTWFVWMLVLASSISGLLFGGSSRTLLSAQILNLHMQATTLA